MGNQDPFSLTLSFEDLEVLVLVDNGGASPLDVEESLGLQRQDTKALFRHLVRRGLLDWQGSPMPSGPCPGPGTLAPPSSTSPHWPEVCATMTTSQIQLLPPLSCSPY